MMTLCGLKEGMDNVVLEIISFNWSQQSFAFLQL